MLNLKAGKETCQTGKALNVIKLDSLRQKNAALFFRAAEAEAEVPVAETGIEPVAVRGATAPPLAAEPAAAAHDTVAARGRTRRIRDAAGRIFTIPIITPLPNVPVHIVEPPKIRPFLPRGMRSISAIAFLPPHAVQTISGIRASRPCSTCVFPFGLSRQTRSAV